MQALRTLNFTEAEIRELLRGRRALSDKDVNMVMIGIFNPENIPNFKKDSAIRNTIKNINRELETNYTVDDFVNRKKLFDIKNSYTSVPLGLSEEEREQYLKTLPRTKVEEIVKPRGKEQKKLFESQKENIIKSEPQSNIKPAAPFLPDPQIANMFAANINPTTGLTQTESALLSPEEQIIRQRLRT